MNKSYLEKMSVDSYVQIYERIHSVRRKAGKDILVDVQTNVLMYGED